MNPLRLPSPRVSGFVSRIGWQYLVLTLFLGSAAAMHSAYAANPSSSIFQCGGVLEANVWKQWDDGGKEYLSKQLIAKRLVAQGDTYALYDFEIMFHNLLSMAQRCQRIDRQLELAEAVKLTYMQLEIVPEVALGKAWICKGGAICNTTNKLIHTEVMLSSVQFLAFATSVANGLTHTDLSAEGEAFIDETVQIAAQHLQRWSNANNRIALQKRIVAGLTDIKDGSSSLFLTDKDLWQIAIYADIAGILVKRPALKNSIFIDNEIFGFLSEQVSQLLKLFHARTTLFFVMESDSQKIVVADLDRGFWRLYADNRYAGYNGEKSPVSCVSVPGDAGKKQIQIRINGRSVEPVDAVGWDISHARRLVHFFDAVDRSREALKSVFNLAKEDIPSQQVMAAFANQLRFKVWNQDANYPLFTNYYSGVNGWYRVAYDNGTGRCSEGIAPYGLSNSFPTGGYATWAVGDQQLVTLGQRLYRLTQSTTDLDEEFIKYYYPSFSTSVNSNIRLVSEQMFWPSLIRN